MVFVIPVGEWVVGPVARWAARLTQFVIYNGLEIVFVVGVGFMVREAVDVWGGRVMEMVESWRESWVAGRRVVNVEEVLINMPDLPPGPLADFVGGAYWEAEDREE